MPVKVFVGNLSYSTTWQNLKDHFRSSGEVLHAVVLGQGNRSKGCGLVEFATPEDAQRAIANLDNSILDGRAIQVREDREPTRSGNNNNNNNGGNNNNNNNGGGNNNHYEGGFKPRNNHHGGNHGGSSSHHQPRQKPVRNFEGEVRPQSTRLFVSNLSWKTTKQNLHLAFGKVPGLKSAEIEMTWNGRAKGSGIIEYENIEQAQAAIDALDKTELDDRVIYVQFDKFVPQGDAQQE